MPQTSMVYPWSLQACATLSINMARILVVGNGGREHAISDKLYEEGHVIFMAGKNPGLKGIGQCFDLTNEELVSFSKEKEIDLVIIGPEAFLAEGLVDLLKENDIRVFGPSKKASVLETSKVFSKKLMENYDIPTASYETFDSYEKARAYLETASYPLVIKADGLAAGKGVVICKDKEEGLKNLEEIMVGLKFSSAGSKVVIEEFLEGEEFSLIALVSGENVYPLMPVQDHKRAFDGDEGPNTGGMGVYMPIKNIKDSDIDEAIEKILRPTAAAMVREDKSFTGVLFAGLMKTKDGIKTIEYNVRFGDPETEVLMPALKSSLYDIIEGRDPEIIFDDRAYMGVVLASKGYPDSYEKGLEIRGLDKISSKVYHMGTREEDGKILTNGGRVLIVVNKAKTLKEARDRVYEDIAKIDCDKLFYRKDIGHLSLKEDK